MGAKGTQTTNTAQTQSYAPAGGSYITNALNQGQAAAQLPFNIPQAPVAGFSPQQLQAFGLVGNAQGSAQPYYNQAQSLYGQAAQQPDVSQFYNPMAGAVNAQLQNTFGMQASQNTGQLTQAAGGVGADRIAVGQAQLANQQGLAQGQTDAALYAQAQSAAQAQQQAQLGAGNALQGLGTNVLNSQLTGANALLGTGGLQQQLSQAQLNSPYQQQLAQAAFPYQQAQFNAGITGALAPALGGTTQGTGTSQTQYNPSIFSQILGGAGALGSIGGYLGGSGGKGAVSGVPQSVDALGEAALVGLARGGAVNSYASGGTPVYSVGLDETNQPIDVSKLGLIPQGNLPQAQSHQPSINLNANVPNMQQQQSNSLSNLGQTLGNIGKLFSARGGAVSNPYAAFANGGSITDKLDRLHHQALDTLLAAGGSVGSNAMFDDGGTVPDFSDRANDVKAAIASGTFDPQGQDDITSAPWMASNTSASIPLPASRPAGIDAGDDASDAADAPADVSGASVPPNATPTSGAAPSSPIASGNPYAASNTDNGGPSLGGFLKSPYAALLQASLGAFTPTGFAGGLKSGMETFQKQESLDQEAKRLLQEAQQQNFSQTQLSAYQKASLDRSKFVPVGSIQTAGGQVHPLVMDQAAGNVIDAVTGKPPTDADKIATGKGVDPNIIARNVSGIVSGNLPPTLTGMYGASAAVRAGLDEAGFDLPHAQLQWQQAQKQVTTLNGPQITRLMGLSQSVDNSINEVTALGQQLHNSGIPLINAAKLQSLMQTEGNSPRGQLATRYITAVNTVKSEFANAEAGGYAPHDAVWQLANQQINGNYGEQQLKAGLGEVQRLIRYRINAIPNINQLGPNAANRYTGNAGSAGAQPFNGRTATNPQTGQKMREIAPNQWQPIQ